MERGERYQVKQGPWNRLRRATGVIGVRHQFRCSAKRCTLRASQRLGEFGLWPQKPRALHAV